MKDNYRVNGMRGDYALDRQTDELLSELTQHCRNVVAIHERFRRERRLLTESKQPEERALRSVLVKQAENDLAAELAHLDMSLDALPEMGDD
jgi:hypothetical protein